MVPLALPLRHRSCRKESTAARRPFVALTSDGLAFEVRLHPVAQARTQIGPRNAVRARGTRGTNGGFRSRKSLRINLGARSSVG